MLICIDCIYADLLAQVSKVDSLENLVSVFKAKDTARVNLLNRIAYCLYYNNSEKSLEYAYEAERLADSLDYALGVASSTHTIGLNHYYLSNYTQAIDYHHKSLFFKEKLGDSIGISRSLNNIGGVFYQMGSYSEAHEYYQKSLEIREALNDTGGIAYSLNNIGIIYEELGDYSRALENYEKSLKLKEELGDQKGIASSLNNIGHLSFLSGDYNKALLEYEQALEIDLKLDNKPDLVTRYMNIGDVYWKLKNTEKAIYYLNKSVKLARKIGCLIGEKYDYERLFRIYESTGNYKKAFESHVILKALNDSIFSEKNIKEVAALTYKYKHQKEKHAIELKQQKKDAVLAKERQKTKYRVCVFFAVCTIVIIFLAAKLRIRSIKISAEKEMLLNEIKILESVAVVHMASSNNSSAEKNIDRTKIDSAIKTKLNNSDWNILILLCKNPTIKNRQLSEQISLSIDGVRSSLKKMYRLFNINNESENQRMALVVKAFRISNSL